MANKELDTKDLILFILGDKNHGPRTHNEGKNQRNLKFEADVPDKYASAVPKNLGLGFDFRRDFLTACP